MARSLRFERILDYYDQPELFIAADAVDTKYLCMAIPAEAERPSYLCVPVSPSRLHDFLFGKVDLRSSFKSPENGEVYLATAIGDLSAFPVDSIDPVTIREEWLPEEGLLYGQVDHESELVKESIERNRTVLHFALEKVDTADRNAIPVVVLGKALDAFQRMVMHAFRKELSQLKKVEREQWKSPAIYQLVAFAASPGSFRLHLEPEAAGDLFGESEISKGLDRIDKTIVPVQSLEEAVQVLTPQRGHFLSAYRDLLRVVVETETKVYYDWASPLMKKPVRRDISRTYARNILDYLEQKAELTQELKTFRGLLIRADVDAGRWSLREEDEGITVSGRCASNVTLAGLALEDKVYIFECEELVSEEQVSGREITEYVLQKHAAG